MPFTSDKKTTTYVPLKSYDGKDFGEISYKAYNALKRGELDSYKPVDDKEKKILNDFQTHITKLQQQKILDEYKNNPVIKKYNIDPTKFTPIELEEWGKEHGYELVTENGSPYMQPKRTGGFLGIGSKKVPTEEEEKDFKVLNALAANNTYKAWAQNDGGAITSFSKGLADGVTLGATALFDKKHKKAYEESGLPEEDLTSMSEAYAKTSDKHKIAGFSGELIGNLAITLPIGGAVRAGTAKLLGTAGSKAVTTAGAASGAKNIPKWVQWAKTSPVAREAMNDGITFAITGTTRTANSGADAEDIMTSAAVNLLGGAVGGGVESILGGIGTKLLFDKGLQHKVIPEIVRNATANAVGGAAQNVTSYTLYPEHMKPSARDFALDLATDFAFGALFSGIDLVDTSNRAKANLDNLTTAMSNEYSKMIESYRKGNMDSDSLKRFASNVIEYNGIIKSYLTGKGVSQTIDGKTISFEPNQARFVGQEKYINNLVDNLDAIAKRANDYYQSNVKTADADAPKADITARQADAPKAAESTSDTNASTNVKNTAVPDVTQPKSTVIHPVEIGDTFTNNNTGDTLRVVNRNDTQTTVETIQPDGTSRTRNFNNEEVDTLNSIDKFTRIDNASTESAEPTPTQNNVVNHGNNYGVTTTAFTNDNQPISMRYKVVSADDLIASNDTDGDINPNYPQELQPRERSRMASVSQVYSMSKNIIPEKLGESANVSDGSPIVDKYNVVESGNGRVMALKLMYRDNTEVAQRYINFIKNNADKFGIDANNLPQHPVLVRERETDVDRVEFVKKANESNLSAMSATELAKTDAERLTDNVLNLLVPNDDGNLNTADNKNFISAVLNNVFPKNDINSVIGANGGLSSNGLERITNAMFYKAYNDVALATRLAESLDNDMKNITNVLLNIAPKVVAIKNGIKSGIYYDVDLSRDIVDAITYLQNAKRENLSVEEFSRQQSMFAEASDIVKMLAYVFEQKNRGAKQATLIFNNIFDIIMSKDPNQVSFFPDEQKLTKEGVLDEATKRYNDEQDNEQRKIIFSEGLVSQRSGQSPKAVDEQRIVPDTESNTVEKVIGQENLGNRELRESDTETGIDTRSESTVQTSERGTEKAPSSDEKNETKLGERKAELSYDDFTLDKVKHTKTNEDIWVIKPKNKVRKEDFAVLKDKIKDLGGYYSSYAITPHGKGGFVFKDDPSYLFGETVNPEQNVTDTTLKFQKATDEQAETQKSDDYTATEKAKANKTGAVGQLIEDYSGTVDNILSVSDETAKDFADKRVAVEVLKNTPSVILDNVEDARNLKVIINYNKLYLAVRKDGVFKGHYHNLGAETAKRLPEFLENPDAVIQLANGRLNLFSTVETEKGSNGIISVELNSTKDIGGKNEDYNVVVTMFSSDDKYAQNLISGDGVTEKYKREDLSQVNPQLYKWLATINDKSSTNNIVSQDSNIVNSSIHNNSENYTAATEKAKEDFKVGDIISVDGKQWRVTSTGFTLTFENLDKNDSEATFQHIGGMDSFKNTHDYTVIKENAENAEQKSELLARKSGTDDRGLYAESSGTDVKERTETVDGHDRTAGGQMLPSNAVRGRGYQSGDGNDSERVYGRTDATDSVQETGRTDAIKEAPEVIDTVDKAVRQERPSNKNNYVIKDEAAAELDNTAPSAENNIEAIELLLKLENEGRAATADEKNVLAKYKGWGGINLQRIDWKTRQRLYSLLDNELHKNIEDSGTNAFFTPTKVIDAMYNGLKQMGFKGGNVLEPSMGTGNFFGRMPAAMSAKSALTGIELESYTARIAQYLYPGATVINKPFQDVVIKNGAYDLVIGNVPFGSEKLSYNKKKYSIHNYFIISSLDKVKDGGIVAVITSAGTLDSYAIDARSAIMDKADVIACYKLPAGVFSRNAKTDVQADLLILRKRAKDKKPVGDSILNVTEKDGLRLNEYFVKHPENILGTLAKGHNAWGEITTVLNNGSFEQLLSDAMKKLPKNLISGEISLKPVETIVTTSSKPRFFEKNGKIYADDGAGTATQVTNGEQTIRDYIAVRDAYKTMLDAYERNLPETEITPLREALNKAYDNFVKKHTAISGDGKKKIGKEKSKNNTFLEDDSDYYLLCGLEKYNKKKNKFEKSSVFTSDTLRKRKVTSADTSAEALAISLNEKGGIDFDVMSDLTGKTEQQLANELKGEIVYTPSGKYELIDIYLSGDIYEKLEEVKGKPEFKEQEEMLKKVLPTPKDAAQITVKLGANYIDPKYIKDFAREVFNEIIHVDKNSAGNWVIDKANAGRYGELVNSKYGCKAYNAIQLLQKILNDADIVATQTITVGDTKKTVFDKKMTDIAVGKTQDIRNAFENWIFKDTGRRNDIVNRYNRMYNAIRPLDYKNIADKLTFDTMDKATKEKLYPHQRKAIARFLFGGNTLFAHGVGTGKTLEMVSSVMEARRMGIINKAAMVVPNNKVVDFKNDILEAYPTAKTLIIDAANKKRQAMLGLINSNDWDIILIPRTTFTKIPVSAEMQKNFFNNQLEAINREIAEAEYDSTVTKRQINALINKRKTIETKIKELDAETKRDISVDFDKLGIDCICVDEAHNYKSITTPSKLQIKGLVNNNDAQQANDMLMKLDYLRSVDGKIIFGTGTPITNTVSEIYNMIKMVRPGILEDAGIHSLDEWVNTFANVESKVEIGIDGAIKDKATKAIRSFINSKEMIGMFRQFADIVFTQDVIKDLPKGVFQSVEIDSTKEHKLIKEAVRDTLSSASGKDKLGAYGEASGMLNASALDLRMLAGVEKDINPLKDYSSEELDYADSKINTMVNYVVKHYKESNDIKGTQIIFCDAGAGTGTTYTFNAHKDIKNKLVKQGIPENEIVIVKSQSDAKLEELYAQVNKGDVRVLIGTSAKMAEGLNVQERVVAIHHPTVSYKPSDLEQSDARGIRKGNINKEVNIYRYLQGDTFDSHKWQAIDRKSEMINNALRGDDVGEIEDIGADENGGADIDPAMAMAITSGNPLVKAKIDIDKKVDTLKTIKNNYQSEIYRYEDIMAKYPQSMSKLSQKIANIEKDMTLREKYGKDTKIIIKDKSYEKKTDANKALNEAVKMAPKNGNFTKIGEYNGFSIMFKGDTGGLGYVMTLKGFNDYEVDYTAQGDMMARFAGVLNRFDKEADRLKLNLEGQKKDLEIARQEVNKPFERESELTEALAEQKQITYDYEHYSETRQKSEEAESEKDSGNKELYDKVSDNDRWKTEYNEQSNNKKANKPVFLGSIVEKIRTKFDIPVATGKVTDPEARGKYKQQAEVIRTRIADNLPTISHELGHHLDKLYSFSTKDSVNELIKAMSPEFLILYSADVHPQEAIAEFVRTYLKSITEAKELCSAFYNDFVSTLSKADLQSINEIASDFNKYLSMDFDERVKSAIVPTKQANKRTVKEAADAAYTEWIDAFYPIKQAVDYVEETAGTELSGSHNAYTLATNSLNASTIAAYLTSEGFRDLNGNILDEMSFKECIEDVKAKDLNILSEYLVLKHSLELINLEMRVFADDTLENTKEINEAIKRIEESHPEMKTAAENLYRYQRNLLKYYLVDSGLLSPDGFKAMIDKYPCYVPFYRATSKGGGHAKGTFANQNVPIKRIKGSGLAILNPLESIVRNTEKFVKAATKNQVMQLLTKYADEVGGFGKFIEKVNPDMLPHAIDISRYKDRFTDKLQSIVGADDFLSVTNLLDEILNDTVVDFTPAASANKKIVTVMNNGNYSYYQVHDAALYKAIAEMTPQQLSGALKVTHYIMLPMKMLITQLNPLFASYNIIRDIGTAYKLSEINNPAEFAYKYLASLKYIVTNDEIMKQYKAMGGGHSSVLASDINQIKRMVHEISVKDMGKARRLAYSLIMHPIENITSLNDIIESIPRVMEFARTLEAGGDMQMAIYNADDITTNFKRHGSGKTAKAVNESVMFNNASLQGLDKTYRTLTGKDKGKKLLKWCLTALFISAIEYFYNRTVDKEGYETNLSSYTKNNFYNFAIGDGKFISIPKAREVALLDSFTERTIEYVFGNKDAYYDFGGYLAQQLLPPMLPQHGLLTDTEEALHDIVGNTIFGGWADIAVNKDFRGRPIESKYEQDRLESHERYNDRTSKPAYYLGQKQWARNQDLSPKKIDHLISSYLGIVGSVIQAYFPMDKNNTDYLIGLRNRFVKDSAYSTDVINRLWDNTEKAEKQFHYDSNIDNAIEYEQNAIITNYVSQMNAAIYALPMDEQRDARKYLLKILNNWNYDTTESQQQMKTVLGEREISDNILIDSLPKSLYEWTENKQKYEYQMTPKEYDKFITNYLKFADLLRKEYYKKAKDRDDYMDKLSGLNGDVMKKMRSYYNKAFKPKASKR